MTNELAQASDAMTAIIALNPQQMADAQERTQTWVERKLAAAMHEEAEADKVVTMLDGRGLSATSARALLNAASLRVRFYRKVRRALGLGYVVIPPFNFASVRDPHEPQTEQRPQRSHLGKARAEARAAR